jgi:hypothetical protein
MAQTKSISDEEAAQRWRIVEPGLLGLPTTQITIKFRPTAAVPYEILWKGQQITQGLSNNLNDAKKFAKQFAADLIEMGLDP